MSIPSDPWWLFVLAVCAAFGWQAGTTLWMLLRALVLAALDTWDASRKTR